MTTAAQEWGLLQVRTRCGRTADFGSEPGLDWAADRKETLTDTEAVFVSASSDSGTGEIYPDSDLAVADPGTRETSAWALANGTSVVQGGCEDELDS